MPACGAEWWIHNKGSSFTHLDTFSDFPGVYLQFIPICNTRIFFLTIKTICLPLDINEKVHQKFKSSNTELPSLLLFFSLSWPGRCHLSSSLFNPQNTTGTNIVNSLSLILLSHLPGKNSALRLLHSYQQPALCLPAALPSSPCQLLQTLSLVPPFPSTELGPVSSQKLLPFLPPTGCAHKLASPYTLTSKADPLSPTAPGPHSSHQPLYLQP